MEIYMMPRSNRMLKKYALVQAANFFALKSPTVSDF